MIYLYKNMYMYIPSLSLFFRVTMHTVKQPLTHAHRTQRGKNIQYANNQKKRRAGRFHSVSSFLKHASSQSPPQHPHEWCRQIKKQNTHAYNIRAHLLTQKHSLYTILIIYYRVTIKKAIIK
ncbi:unnamed protein product [Ixodes persulcatus]